MTDDDQPTKKGRGHPPSEYWYPKGVSGNPWGRPLGSKNKQKRAPKGLTPSEQIAWEESHRKVKTSEGEMEAIRAVKRAQIATAAKGGTNAQRNALEHIEQIEAKQRTERRALMLKAEEYKQQYEMDKRTRSKAQLALIYDELLPHPEDVEVDWETSTIAIHGPASAKERKIWDQGLHAHARMRSLVFRYRREVEAYPLDRTLHMTLADCTDRFMRNNDRLPERYRLRRLPIWKRGAELPIPPEVVSQTHGPGS